MLRSESQKFCARRPDSRPASGTGHYPRGHQVRRALEKEIELKIETQAVHAGDRKKPGPAIPVTTPIYTASSYFYDSMEQLDRTFGRAEPGYSYARYDNPSNAALEELMAVLESGHGALACASGMTAVEMAVATALADRRKSVVAADALYGATISLLMKVLEPSGVAVRFADVCDLNALRAAVAEAQPGCIQRFSLMRAMRS